MKERPIIMSGNHPKLVLDGIKTQTRRVIKPQPVMGGWNATAEHPSYGWFWKKLYQTWEGEEDFFKRLVEHCPYGQVGDRLWVRETHLYYTDPFAIECYVGFRDGTGKSVDDFPEGATVVNIASDPKKWKWRPSIHMPRWASRISLEITEVRVERVQEISVDGAIAEGLQPMFIRDKFFPARGMFKDLWDSLNAKRGYGWEVNPWVWVISFKVV